MLMNSYNLREGDSVNGCVITKLTDKSCWLDGERKSWSTVNGLIDIGAKTKSRYNPDKEINWTNRDEVVNFYNSFREWSFYVSQGDVNSKNLFLLEVKDNLVFHEGKYYLAGPAGDYNNPNQKKDVEDGAYWVHLITRSGGWFGVEKRKIVNVFSVRMKVNTNPTIEDIKKLRPNSKEIYCRPSDYHGFSVDYSQSGRSGLSINNISLRNFKKFFIERYCTERWGYDKPFIIIPDKIISQLEYGGYTGFGEGILQELNNILNSASYSIDDDDSWGEYSLNSLKISDRDSEKFFAVIQERLNLLT
jgi:hypothetical protein